MRVLVAGGAGYIGSHTVRQLLAGGHDVTVYDNLEYGHRQAVPAKRLVVGDLGDVDLLDRLLVARRIEAVVHFAAFAYVGESVTSPARYYTNNLLYSLQLLDLCRRNGIRKFVFSSTCATYGVPNKVPIAETQVQCPVNPYGNTKLAFERALADYAGAYPFGSCALRYFNAAGAAADNALGEDHTPETHLIPLVIQAALGRIPHVTIFGADYPTPDGTCVRDYVHVEDLAAAHVAALERLREGHAGGAFNLGTGKGASVKEVVRAAERATGRKVRTVVGPRRPGDPPYLVAAPGRAKEVLGWEPEFRTIDAIVASAWKWHSRHPKGYPDRSAKEEE